jgi:hypothetical protein
MKFFISYAAKATKELAGEVKENLELYDGLEAFVAHDDIKPGTKWEEEILEALVSSDYFLPIQTEELIASSWCQQEAGIAVAKGIKIVPLIPYPGGCDPVGFYAKFQGAKLRVNAVEASIKSFLEEQKILTEEEEEHEVARDIKNQLILFKNSGSWSEAGTNTYNLLKYEDVLSKAQIKQIAKAASENGEIKHSFAARPLLSNFFRKNSNIVPEKYLKEYLES